MTTDLIGTPLTEPESALLAAYHTLEELMARQDLPPAAASNTRIALTALNIAVTDLALHYQHLTDTGA